MVPLMQTFRSKATANTYAHFAEPSINNELYDGLTWRKAFYLDPIGIEDMSLTATNPEDINTTQLYQNPYWPMTAGKALE